MKATNVGLAVASALSVAACNSLPQAGLVYGHKRVTGLEIGVGDTANPGAHVKLGQTEDLVTYVPVAVKGPDIVPVVGKSGPMNADLEPPQRATLFQALLKQVEKGGAIDAISIFSSFALKGDGNTQSGVTVSLGNVFATGIAAQRLAGAQVLLACADLTQKVANEKDADKKSALQKLMSAFCTG